MKLASLLTLSDSPNYMRLSDPVAIILGGVTIAQQLFPNLFGGSRKLLTDADWMQVFPGSGYWNTQIRNYLKERVLYNTDLKFAYPFTNQNGMQEIGHIAYFVMQNRNQICPEVPAECWVQGGRNIVCQECLTKFSRLLAGEGSGGNGGFPPLPGMEKDWWTYLLYGAIGIGAIMLLNKPKRKAKK